MPAPVVGRLAPSPTGALHLGHAFSFLLTYWYVRSQGGRLILRLEDVDARRASREHIESAEQDLAWLGIDWDGAAIVQSTRLPTLHAAARELLQRGLAYPCVCTRSDLLQSQSAEEAPGAPHAGAVEPRYPGTCRGRFSSLEEAQRATGREAGLRFRTPEGAVTFSDLVFGPQSYDVQASVGDFLILRRDKTPAYQLAIVVDDHTDQVSDVLRGADLLPSTARQLLVARALGYAAPRYAHLPLVCDQNGRRLSKREAGLSLHELRQAGRQPGEIVAWAARAAGMKLDSGAAVSARDLVEGFQLAQVIRSEVLLGDEWAPTPAPDRPRTD